MQPTTFVSAKAFRGWLEQHHDTASEIWVCYYKKSSGKQSITWPESVDEALCFGWIDSVRKSLDDERYVNRFTPRRKGSVWSAANIRRVDELTEEGRMHPAGLAAFEARREDRSGIYSYERRDEAVFDPVFEQRFRSKERAWAFFEKSPRSYRQAAIRWVMTAKKEETRDRRLGQLIEWSAAGERVPPLTPPPRRSR
jgi:uncharacterized protein YdeI (YjbR/CyaY-like superfamily)